MSRHHPFRHYWGTAAQPVVIITVGPVCSSHILPMRVMSPFFVGAIIEMVGTQGQAANRDEPTCGYRLGVGSLPGDVY